MIKKIVLIDRTGIDEFVLKDLERLSEQVVVYNDDPQSTEEILHRAEGADVIMVSWRTRLTGQVISKLPDLKYIGMCCSLYDAASANVDINQSEKQGIVVKGCYHYGDKGVVEYIFSELIRLFSGVGDVMYGDEPIEMEGLKLGIIGLGAVGELVANTGEFFNMSVSYHNRTPKLDSNYQYQNLNDLLESSNVISIHLPRNTIVLDQDAFDVMGNGKVLISLGLGLSFEMEAFDQWIRNENNYAIFDMASTTEAFRERYKGIKNVMVGKHVSGFTKNARKRLAHKAMDNLAVYLKG